MGCAALGVGVKLSVRLLGEEETMLRLIALSVAPVALFLSVASTAFAEPAAGAPQPIAGLREPARVTVDEEGISHVRAHNDHDLYFMQGWVHVGDRLFQMD